MQDRNKRIAKNTMVLYLRTFITMIVSLYTSRIMLEALGIDNYGINNVVGGIVSFSAIITGSMSAAGSRYITYALGENNKEKLTRVFSTVFKVQVVLGIIVIIVLEIVGVWFLNKVANIPTGRMIAANWVLQCSIMITFIGLIQSPFNASIIAHEKMSFYAWLSIIEVTIKLFICILILHYPNDRLILYSILWTLSTILFLGIYILYCKQFQETTIRGKFDKPLFKEIMKFSGWNLLNNTTWILCTNGVNMLINVYYGVAYNAARGVASSVNGCVQNFIQNISISFRPQITKSYANHEYNYCFQLVNRSSKFVWLMMLLFIVPISIEADTLLHIWLVDVPPMASLFVVFTLYESLATQSGIALFNLVQANGNLKRYTIKTALYSGLVFPLSWIFLYLGAPVWIPYPIFIFVFLTINIIRLCEIKRLMPYNWRSFVSDVVKPCLMVSIISYIIPIIVWILMPQSILRFAIVTILGVGWTSVVIYYLGLSNNERNFIKIKIMGIIEKIGLIKYLDQEKH